MFDLEKALEPVQGLYTYDEVRNVIGTVRVNNLHDLAPEVTCDGIIELSRRAGYFTERDGYCQIKLP